MKTKRQRVSHCRILRRWITINFSVAWQLAKNRVVINNALGGDARAGGDGKLRCTEYSEMRYCGWIIF